MTRQRSGSYSAVGSLGNRYELLDQIGANGLAEIHRARLLGEHGFTKLVTLAVLRPELVGDHRCVERFSMEARIGALFEHPNITQVFDFLELEGRPTIVMEHMRGTDLSRLIVASDALEKRIAPELCVFIAIEVLHGLAYAHAITAVSAGAPGATSRVHGAISPASIMVGEAGQVKLIGFGAAEASGAGVDARADLFSLAIVLREMLAKHDDLPPRLVAIIARALALEPERRYASATAMADELAQWLAAEKLSPNAAQLAQHLVETLSPPPIPTGDGPQPTPAPGSHLDMSQLEAVLAEIESGPIGTSFDQLVSGTWKSPFEDRMNGVPGAAEWSRSSTQLDPWVFPATLARLARENASGALIASDGLRNKSLYLAQGQLIHVASNSASEPLASQPTSAGIASAEALEEQAAARVIELVSWSQGFITFEPGRVPSVETGRSRSILPLIARGIRQSFSQRRALSVLEAFAERRIAWLLEPERISESLDLPGPEAQALIAVRSAIRVNDALNAAHRSAPIAMLIAIQAGGLRLPGV